MFLIQDRQTVSDMIAVNYFEVHFWKQNDFCFKHFFNSVKFVQFLMSATISFCVLHCGSENSTFLQGVFDKTIDDFGSADTQLFLFVQYFKLQPIDLFEALRCTFANHRFL